ncbi:MAG TPA: PRC-barrel domain-containing protein [Gaiellaceae bacterium]|nr:PRC-barrel domain-containing protein [Gaiellaceae bacterium]
MTSFALRAPPDRLRRRPLRRLGRRRLPQAEGLLSVAGLIGAPVRDRSGRHVGHVVDLLIRPDDGERYPAVTGAVVHTLHGRTVVALEAIAELLPDRLLLRETLEREPVHERADLVALARDVLDRQIVDVDGGDVRRVSDLVLARRPDGLRLVGVDVSIRTMLRRLGPRSLPRKLAPDRIYDWSSIAAFSARGEAEGSSVLHLTQAVAELKNRGPADVQTLLDDLPPHERTRLEGATTAP